MVYQYIACNDAGDIVKGKLAAATEEAINDMLSYAGYRLIYLKPYVPFFSAEKLTAQLFPVKPVEIILFYRQLALLLESGINIVTSLELLQEQMANRTLKKVLHEIIAELRAGSQLSRAMSKHPQVFSQLCCRTLSIGEQTGGMEAMLRQVADYMEKEINARKGIKGALTYPIIALVVAIGVVGLMVGFVLPAFADLYASMGAEMPAMTRILMDFSDWMRSNIMVIVLTILIVAGAVFIYSRTAEGKYQIDKLILRIPLLGRVMQLNELSRCCRSISLLFKAGLPLTEIMPMVIHGVNSRVVAQALYNVQEDMLKGEGLSRPMAKNPVFLPMMVQMVKVGEETGSLDNSLFAVAQNYETEAEDKTKSLIALIQPAMTLVIAGIVGVIALSMISAMYSVYGQAF